MAYPSVTNSFTDATTIDAVQLNENFNDIVNGVSDGTKDIQVANSTVNGYADITGDVYTTALTNYSNTVTISGLDTVTTKYFYYKRIGNIVHVWFYVLGNATVGDVIIFDLPYACGANFLNMYIPILTGTTEVNGCGLVFFNAASEVWLYYRIDSTKFPDGDECASGYFSYEAA